MHVGQPRGLSRHPVVAADARRRHREPRHRGDQGRLVRRHEPHVLRRRARRTRAASGGGHLRGDARGHSRGASGRDARRRRLCDPAGRASRRLQRCARILRARNRRRVSRRAAGAALRPPRHRRAAAPRDDLHDRADAQRGQARHARAGRRLDGRHEGPFAVRAVGAHGRGDGAGRRRADRRREAARVRRADRHAGGLTRTPPTTTSPGPGLVSFGLAPSACA
ncbi:hypothetical protein BVI2075_580048 [Burkholderia vietnamiensis]|nr:hypothetical protein BVI1335_1220051 [Burkholderia vietnamiensis]CAG9214392.1 hypothetical protein BVI2075_580048 [Burkholderia vietnamiensis]